MMVGFSGFLAGGAAQQSNVRRQQATADRGVDVQEDRLEIFRQELQQKGKESQQERLIGMRKQAQGMVEKITKAANSPNAAKAGMTPNVARGLIAEHVKIINSVNKSLGGPAGGDVGPAENALIGIPEVGPTAQKLSDVGSALDRPLTEQETRRGGGVAEPAGQNITVNTGDVLAGEDKPAARTTRDNLIGINDNLEAATRALGSLKKSPLAAGVVGGVIESGLGIVQSLGQLAGVEIAPQFQADFDKARNDARLLTGQLISVVTGEESSRFSNQEREITNEAQRTLTSDASAPQALAALKNMIGVFESSQTREIGKAVAQAKIDIKTPAGREELSNILRSAGFSEERIVDATLDQMRLAGIRL